MRDLISEYGTFIMSVVVGVFMIITIVAILSSKDGALAELIERYILSYF